MAAKAESTRSRLSLAGPLPALIGNKRESRGCVSYYLPGNRPAQPPGIPAVQVVEQDTFDPGSRAAGGWDDQQGLCIPYGRWASEAVAIIIDYV